MRKFDQNGSINILLIPLILVLVLFFGAIGFGAWAYVTREDYKNNSDQKVATAVSVAQKETASAKDNEFIEREKQPLKDYKGPAAYGATTVKYPKTWSAYIDESGGNNLPLDAYFHPNFVPGIRTDTNFAFRMQVSGRSFDQEVQALDSTVKNGKLSAKPYKPVNVGNVVGMQLDGEILTKKQGTLILIPIRDKTIKLWTESDQFKKDFTDSILANFSFTP